MNAKEWVEFLQNNGVDICVADARRAGALVLGPSDGAYFHGGDQILLTRRLNKETLFHELVHWTATDDRLARNMDAYLLYEDHDRAAEDLEESIAWEATKLLVKRFGGGNRYYYIFAPIHSMKNSPEAKWFGRQAYEYICNEFGL